MSLEFADFANFYRDSGWTEEEQRGHLAVIDNILECIVRVCRYGDPDAAKMLGITLGHSGTQIENNVESKGLEQHFNEQTVDHTAESDHQ